MGINKIKNFFSFFYIQFDSNGKKILFVGPYTMRFLIGFFGMLLPCLILIWTIYFSDCKTLLSSISAYYYTPIRDYFVGIICAVSFYLYCYHGYDLMDLITFKLASFSALGIVLFPTSLDLKNQTIKSCLAPTLEHGAISGYLHLFFAFLFFASIAFTCIHLFTKGQPGVDKNDFDKKKKFRNKFYMTCGIIIFLCLGLIVVASLVKKFFKDIDFIPESLVFFLETIALYSFSISWLMKSKVLKFFWFYD